MQKKEGQNFYCEISVLEDQTILEFPYIYYPGYIITVNNERVKGFESPNGFLAISVNQSNSSYIHINYMPTYTMFISYILSIVTLLFFLLYNLKLIHKRHPEN